MAARLGGRPSPRRKPPTEATPEETQSASSSAPVSRERPTPNLWMTIALLALLLALLASASAVYLLVTRSQTPTEQAQVFEPGPMVELGEFIVNLGNVSERRFLRTAMTAAFTTSDKRYVEGNENRKAAWLTDLRAELKSKEPVFKDVIVTGLSRKTAEQLGSPRGKEEMKAELITRLNQYLSPETHIQDIYLTEFIIQ